MRQGDSATPRLASRAGPNVGTNRLIGWSRRHDLALYVGLAFLISWAAWPLVRLNPDSSPLVPFGPLVAAVVVSLLTGGSRELRTLLSQLGRWSRPLRWYLIALVGPAVIALVAGALGIALGARPAPFQAGWPAIAGTFVTTLVMVGLFEEVGWRGYALPRLQRHRSALRAALLLGAIWSVWHLPELLSDPGGQRPPIPFVIFVLAQSVILTWQYNSSLGSLPIVMVSHAATNTTAQVLLPLFAPADYQLMWWVFTGLWVAAAALVATFFGTGLTSPERRPLSFATPSPLRDRRTPS
jgi:membrane protease YdiL (CAAX protease family)